MLLGSFEILFRLERESKQRNVLAECPLLAVSLSDFRVQYTGYY